MSLLGISHRSILSISIGSLLVVDLSLVEVVEAHYTCNMRLLSIPHCEKIKSRIPV